MIERVKKEIVGVVLLNLGGPDSLQSVRPFLYNLFSDRQIIRLGPSFMQRPLASLISTIRSKKTKRLYELLGGKSPILEITKSQAKALEKTLNNQSEVKSQKSKVDNSGLRTQDSRLFKVYVAMRYWHPLIQEVVPEIFNDGIRKIVVLSLYPHYSIATTGSSLLKFKEVMIKIYQPDRNEIQEINNSFDLQEVRDKSSFTVHCTLCTVHCVTSWFDHPLYIDSLVTTIKKGLESFTLTLTLPLQRGGKDGGDIHILFSAHSLPEKLINKGDPYVNQIMGTIREISKRIQIKWHLSYQSRSGPVRWLKPSTEEKLREFSREGIKNVLVVPISFISDHIETLYEIDILYKNMAEKLGITLMRVDSLNVQPGFIEALKDIVLKNAEKVG
ncbi:MAG: ferrochelatase [Nitrospirota bacterium]